MASQFRPRMVIVNSCVLALGFMLTFTLALPWCLVATTHRSVLPMEGRFYGFCSPSRYIRTKLHPSEIQKQRYPRKRYRSKHTRPSARLYPLEVTLNAERQVCQLGPTLVPKEVRQAHYSCRSDPADCKICSLIVQACLGTWRGIGGRSAAGPRQTQGDGRVTGDGVKPGGTVSEVSSRAESGALVVYGGGPQAPRLSGGHLCPRRSRRHWHRRHIGTAAGGEDQSQRDLSRSGALLALPYGESQWAALALREGAGRDSVGRTGLGVALSHSIVSFGAVSPAAGAAAQDVTGVGGASHCVVPPLAVRTVGGLGGR